LPGETFQQIGEDLLDNFDTVRRKEILDRLSKMIDYGIKRQDWYEDQRNKALTLGIALLGLASFLVTGLLNPAIATMVNFRFFAGATLISIVGTAGAIIAEYGSGASESYTHRDLADIRSWFFAYVVDRHVAQAAIANDHRKIENQAILREAWNKFVAGWIEYDQRPQGFVAEDLQQVFILYLFQAMRRNSLRKMISSAKIGASIIIILLTTTIICAMFRV
jgi:hypothetical protein